MQIITLVAECLAAIFNILRHAIYTMGAKSFSNRTFFYLMIANGVHDVCSGFWTWMFFDEFVLDFA